MRSVVICPNNVPEDRKCHKTTEVVVLLKPHLHSTYPVPAEQSRAGQRAREGEKEVRGREASKRDRERARERQRERERGREGGRREGGGE